MKKLLLSFAALLFVMPVAATAAGKGSPLEGWSFGVGMGVLGGGNINVGYRTPYNPGNSGNWMNKFVFRADFNTWAPFRGSLENLLNDIANDEIDENRREDGTIEFTNRVTAKNAEFKSYLSGRTFGALVDFHPFTYTRGLRGLRISGGYYFGDMNIGINAGVDGLSSDIPYDFSWENVNIGGTVYAPIIDGLDAGARVEISRIRAEPRFTLRSTGPYAGFGWDIGLFSKLKLTFDAGVTFTKPHELSMTDNLDNLDFAVSSSTITINIDGDARIPGDVGPELSRVIQNALAASNVSFTTANNNIIVNTNQLIANNRSAIDSALDEARRDRDKAINDVNRELKNYGYLPMIKIGFQWRF